MPIKLDKTFWTYIMNHHVMISDEIKLPFFHTHFVKCYEIWTRLTCDFNDNIYCFDFAKMKI